MATDRRDAFVRLAAPSPSRRPDRRATPLSLLDREAVARFLYEIGILATRIIEIMDDLREADGVFLPMVVLTEQRRALRAVTAFGRNRAQTTC